MSSTASCRLPVKKKRRKNFHNVANVEIFRIERENSPRVRHVNSRSQTLRRGCVMFLTLALCLALISTTRCLPTVYKYNDNRILEADLVPVSSTVIPLPVYEVSRGLNVAPSLNDEKVEKPSGPIKLVTVHSQKKKVLPELKPKPSETTSVKEVDENEFHN